MFSRTAVRPSYSMYLTATSWVREIIQLIILGPFKLFRPTGCRSYHCSHSETIHIGRFISWIQRTCSFQSWRSGRERRRIYTYAWRSYELNSWTAIRYSWFRSAWYVSPKYDIFFMHPQTHLSSQALDNQLLALPLLRALPSERFCMLLTFILQRMTSPISGLLHRF